MATVKKRNWPTDNYGQVTPPEKCRSRAEFHDRLAAEYSDRAHATGQTDGLGEGFTDQTTANLQHAEATWLYDCAREMDELSGLQPPGEIAWIETALRAQRADLDVYFTPELWEGSGDEPVVGWTLNADNPRGQEYATIDFEVYDKHAAMELATQNRQEAWQRTGVAHGWTNEHTHTAAAILDNTEAEVPGHEGMTDSAGAVAVERWVTGGEDAIGIMHDAVTEYQDWYPDLDISQVNFGEIYDQFYIEAGFEPDEAMETRLQSYDDVASRLEGSIYEVTIRRGEYLAQSDVGQTYDVVSETTPIPADGHHAAIFDAGHQFISEANHVPSPQHPQGTPGGIDPTQHINPDSPNPGTSGPSLG